MAALAPDLEQYVNLPVPSWKEFDLGMNDAGEQKKVTTSQMMIPVRLILADLYLESGNYAKAAEHYFNYLKQNKTFLRAYLADWANYPTYSDLPTSMRNGQSRFF